MPQLNLKPSHKAVRDYYATLRQYDKHNVTHEGAVSSPFETLLTVCAKQVDATLIPQFAMRAPSGNRIVLDGVILDAYGLPFAYFKEKVPALGRKAAELIAEQHETNPQFVTAFTSFYEQCRAAINPNLSKAAVEEILIYTENRLAGRKDAILQR